jgi:hypothetical protein
MKMSFEKSMHTPQHDPKTRVPDNSSLLLKSIIEECQRSTHAWVEYICLIAERIMGVPQTMIPTPACQYLLQEAPAEAPSLHEICASCQASNKNIPEHSIACAS